MQAWSDDQKIPDDGLVTLMADPFSVITRALDMELTHDGPQSLGLINRCKRFALVIQDGVVTSVQLSEGPGDPAGDDFPESTCAPNMLSVLKELGSDAASEEL
uniref:Redoxin domain-containing protein n=1 Tax=Craspedostauros australis TaxID=1486917 RepID=A0A6T6H159_9STRA|mmetsp:Transcript_24965/g.69382  ORF Transcript_24965/g.69382 Transcript_24965/m.69382 type:complete len:103 (+) Transcript_24965:393-701(+)